MIVHPSPFPHLHEVFEDALLLGRVGHTHAHDPIHGAATIQRSGGHLAEGGGRREPPDAQGIYREHTFLFRFVSFRRREGQPVNHRIRPSSVRLRRMNICIGRTTKVSLKQKRMEGGKQAGRRGEEAQERGRKNTNRSATVVSQHRVAQSKPTIEGEEALFGPITTGRGIDTV